MKFRKKPVVIEAHQFETAGDRHALALQIQLWAAIAEPRGDIAIITSETGVMWLSISTLEGAMRADVGDWIIQGVKGEFYPCKPDIFAATYEPVDEASPALSGAGAPTPMPEAEDDVTEHWEPEFTVWLVREGYSWPMRVDAVFIREDDAKRRAAVRGKGWHAMKYQHMQPASSPSGAGAPPAEERTK